MKKGLKKLLVLALIVLVYGSGQEALADENKDLEAYIEATAYMLEENRDNFSQKTIDKLENRLDDSRDLLETRKAEENRAMDLEKRIQEEILNNFKERNKTFRIDVNDYIDEERIHEIFDEALREDKYFYYAIYKGANISTNYYEDTNEDGIYFVESVDFTMTYRQSKEDEKKVDEFVEKWIKDNITDDMTDLEKTKLIHDFIVKRNSYNTGDGNDKSGGYSIYSPASILFGKGGVCNAYATLFDKMSGMAGLRTYYSTGVIKGDGQLHIWNMVKIDDDWYNIDLTWDDPILTSDKKIINEKDFVAYDFFLVSDELIQNTRTVDKDDKRPTSVNSYAHDFENTKIKFEKKDSKNSYVCRIENNKRSYHFF
ncbi:MAG: transglutaminase-like domain-containing protein [Anaerococcus sp.]|nr:transglutaminase-like domain-containing protein [Peptoniphilaceae bacterium]MDY3054710.1 transglutaminase-like domain-containing protein [Anaerococcus sp.]